MKNSKETLAKRNELRRKYRESAVDVPKYIDGVCKACGGSCLLKHTSSFTQTGKPEYRTRCDDCFKLRERENKRDNREVYSLGAKLRKRRKKIELITLMGGKCMRCPVVYNGRNAVIFQFHHIDPSVKEFSVSIGLGNVAFDRVKQELSKCLLLCANCHELEHHEEY